MCRFYLPRTESIFVRRGRSSGKPKENQFILPIIVFVVIVAFTVVVEYPALFGAPQGGEEEGVLECVTCAQGYIGGGCSSIDPVSGEIVPPQKCLKYVEVSEPVGCTVESKNAEFCMMVYSPVCGDNVRTYGNSCEACADPAVAYYIPGTCEAVVDQ